MNAAALAIAMTMALACAPTTEGSEAIPPSDVPSALIGEWSWRRSCDSVADAFRDAGLDDLIRTWLVEARYFPREDLIGRPPCHGAEEARYLYFFESDGQWGMLDDDDVLVDDRRFTIVDEDTIAFGTIRVDHRVSADGELTFDVDPPDRCAAACRDDYAWAVATFAAGTFRRVS